MTREFNKQRRDDSRPSFRKPSPGRYGEERTPRPARPRLNRETVDRAWESGAPTNHADYRPRTSNNNGQPPRNNWRNSRDGQQREYPSSNGRSGSRPYDNRSDSYRDNQGSRNTSRPFERPSFEGQGPRARSFDPDRRNFNDQHFNERRSYSNGSNGNGPRQGYRDNTAPRGPGERYPSRDRGYQSREFERDDRGPRRFDREQSDERRPRSFERGRDNTSNWTPRDNSSRNGQNPRWQERSTRPAARNADTRGRRSFEPNRDNDARFEGDYEGVSNESAPQRPQRPHPPQRSFDRPQHTNYRGNEENESEERYVTRLPDGRVLKGPRPVQRKNAEFWNSISDDTETLLNNVHVPAPQDETAPPNAAEESAEQDSQPIEAEGQETAQNGEVQPAKRKGRTRIASAVTRTKKPRSTGPKPSQRGFKWPTP